MSAEYRVTFRGVTINVRTQKMLLRAEARLGYTLTLYQGSYHKGVGASAGTHDGGGAVDVAPWDYENKVRVLREVGFAAWHRPAIPGVWEEHIHAIAIGDPELSPAARAQVTDYYNGRNGLADNGPDNGPRLNPIPVWPVNIPQLRLSAAIKQFTTLTPKEKPVVVAIQKMLNLKQGEHLVVDGIAGPLTRQAYKRYQRKLNPLWVPGIPGPKNLRLLLNGYYTVV